VRLVAATNRPLEAMIAAGTFRADLYYRLAVFPIELPPLAERASDVPLLAAHLVARAAARHGLAEPALTAAAAELLAAEDWPGNVRQLANVVERAVILADGRPIDAADLAPLLRAPGGAGHREAVRQALIDTDGDKHRAAEMLGISYRTLQRKVREHDLEGVPKYRS
jgi:DNA-binding NtrC family response regulator